MDLNGINQVTHQNNTQGAKQVRVVRRVNAPTGREVIYVTGNISRAFVKANPSVDFLFGDNVDDHNRSFDQRRGKGGQAGAIAGEPNARGIPTLWRAPSKPSDYFNDDAKFSNSASYQIAQAFREIKTDRTVVVPVTIGKSNKLIVNLGTGIAQLPQKAPKLYAEIVNKILELEKTDGSVNKRLAA